MVNDRTDPKKYLVRRYDFRRVPRWDNDGIAKDRQRFEQGVIENFAGKVPCENRDQQDLTELMGGWMCDGPLPNDPELQGFLFAIPFIKQEEAAAEQEDLEAAKKYLINAYKTKDAKVMILLKSIGYDKAIYKASKDPTRFPDFRAFLAPLLQKNLCTDQNLELLFGNVSHVRGKVLTVGSVVANPPPPGSPAYYVWHPILNQSGRAIVSPSCGCCGKEEDNGKLIIPLKKCLACRTISYCSRDCQHKHWVVHKPDCLKAQGKDVPQSVRTKAEAMSARWEEEEKQKEEDKNLNFLMDLNKRWIDYCNEAPGIFWSHDCEGKQYRADLPVKGERLLKFVVDEKAELDVGEDLDLLLFPEGISPGKCRGLGLLCSTRNTNAKILILYERLFADRGDGPFNGLGVVGIYVVDRVKKNKQSECVAVWKAVEPPKDSPNENRCSRMKAYLEAAKALSKPVEDNVELGLTDIKAQMDSFQMIKTPFGHYFDPGFGG